MKQGQVAVGLALGLENVSGNSAHEAFTLLSLGPRNFGRPWAVALGVHCPLSILELPAKARQTAEGSRLSSSGLLESASFITVSANGWTVDCLSGLMHMQPRVSATFRARIADAVCEEAVDGIEERDVRCQEKLPERKLAGL